MSNLQREYNVSSFLQPPTGEVVVDDAQITQSLREKFKKSSDMHIVIGVSTEQRELQLDQRGIAYVEMNSSGRIVLEAGQDGIVATNSLAGCTGAAGFSRRNNGEISVFVSHYDPMVQDGGFSGERSPLNSDMYSFNFQETREHQDGRGVDYLIAYPRMAHSDERVGRRLGKFENWHFYDQLNVTAAQLNDGSRVLFLPYDDLESHNLAAGKVGEKEDIFWNGVEVDFEKYFDQTISSEN